MAWFIHSSLCIPTSFLYGLSSQTTLCTEESQSLSISAYHTLYFAMEHPPPPPLNFPHPLVHGFTGQVVVDATVRNMCCLPDKEFHTRKPLDVHFTGMAVLGQDMIVDNKPCQHINAHTHSIQVCKPTLLPCDVKADRHVSAGTIQSYPQLQICVGVDLAYGISTVLKKFFSSLHFSS